MPKSKPHLFQKGWKGGPGRPPKDKDLKTALKMTRTEVESNMVRFLKMSLLELEDVVKDKNLTVNEHILANISLYAIKNGDPQRLGFLLDRIIGKVRDQIEHTVIRPTIIERLDGSQLQLGAIEGDSE